MSEPRPPEVHGAARGTPRAGVSVQVLRGISRNSAFLAAGHVTSRAVGFVYILILARYLGVESFGTYNLVMSFVLIAITGIEFGLGRLMVRDLARDPALIRPYLATLVPLRGAFALAGYLAVLAVVWMLGYSRQMVTLTAIAALALLPTSVGLLFESLFQARQQMRYGATAEVVLALVQCSVGTAIVFAGGSLEAVLAAGVAAALAYGAFLARQTRASGYVAGPGFDGRLGVTLLRQAVPYAVVTLLAILSTRAELLVLGVLSTADNVGLFSSAAKLFEAAMLLPVVLVSAAAPVISQFHVDARDQLRGVYLWTQRRMLSVTLPAAVAGIVLAEPVITLLFSAEYRRAAPVLQLLFLAFPIGAAHLVNAMVLMMSNRSRLMLANAAVCSGMQLLLAVALIARFGLTGAAVSVLVSQTFNLALSHWCVRTWFVDTAGMARSLVPPAAAGAVAVAVAVGVSDAWGPWALAPALCAYAIVLGVLSRYGPAWPAPPAGSKDAT